jgi:hypothetical protein
MWPPPYSERRAPGGTGRSVGGLRCGGEMALVAPAQLRARLPDGVLERVAQGLARGRDDVRAAAHRRPFQGAVRRVDDDARLGSRRLLAVEDADLVVDQMDRVELRVEGAQGLAEGGVQGVDRAVAVGGGVEHLARDLDLDRGLGQKLGAAALLHQNRVVAQREGPLVAGLVALDEQLERRLGALEREALGLELLDDLAQRLRIHAVELLSELLRPELRVGLAAELADHQAHDVADHARIHVLVGAAGPGRRRAVDAALVGERRPADIGLVVVGGDVDDLGHVAGHLRQLAEAARGHRLVARS